MKLFKTDVLRPEYIFGGSTEFDFYSNKRTNLILCAWEIHELFEVPTDAKAIQFVAYDRPGADRVKVEWDLQLESLRVDGEIKHIIMETEATIVRLLKKHKKNVIYVELEYE